MIFFFSLQEGAAAGSVISSLSDFSAIKELDKITKEIEDLGRLVGKLTYSSACSDWNCLALNCSTLFSVAFSQILHALIIDPINCVSRLPFYSNREKASLQHEIEDKEDMIRQRNGEIQVRHLLYSLTFI